MAVVLMLTLGERRSLMRRNRLFRDRTHPFDAYDDVDLYDRFRFRRQDLMTMVDELGERLELCNRGHTVPPSLQVCVALRYYASGSFQLACADLVGISQPTTSRIISRVTEALMKDVHRFIVFPDQTEANKQKVKFYKMKGFPSVFGAIDGTLINIQRPVMHEEQFVDRKGNHSLNVQVVCNADLAFIDVCARWPGRTHDARVLRQSGLFKAFESDTRPIDGVLLGDSGYMLREWLLTPILQPNNRKEEKYNSAHRTTRTTVERALGVAKRRWHCLRRLRLEPEKACKVIIVCLMLHNQANSLQLPVPDSEDEGESTGDADAVYDPMTEPDTRGSNHERQQVAQGQRTRERFVNRFF